MYLLGRDLKRFEEIWRRVNLIAKYNSLDATGIKAIFIKTNVLQIMSRQIGLVEVLAVVEVDFWRGVLEGGHAFAGAGTDVGGI